MNGVSRSEESRAGVTCPVPLSDIAVKASCLPDGSAEVVCSVNGSDPNYSWRLDGKKISSQSRVTLHPPVSGILRCDVTNTINDLTGRINISCAVPVSVPVVDVECLQNGGAEISCKVEKGTHSSIYLTVTGELEEYNVTGSERTVRVAVPPMSPPDLWNISCWVKNNISQRSTKKMDVTCHARLSAPHIHVSCQSDGSARVSCVKGKDRDVTYQWKVNGEFLPEHQSPNITFTNDNFTSDPLNVSCSVHNPESEKHSDTRQILCPGQTSCLSCWQKSMIGGFVALLVAFPPLFISHWYILRGMDKKSKTLVT